MDFDLSFKGITKFLKKLNGVLVPLVTVSLLLGIILGPTTPFVGDVYTNVQQYSICLEKTSSRSYLSDYYSCLPKKVEPFSDLLIGSQSKHILLFNF